MKLKQKFIASGLHFLISLAVFSGFIFILLYSWFPEPYFTASGGLQGLQIVILVDLVLGPLLTFVIFNLEKPRTELTRDLGVIVLLQVSALAWGIYAISGQRPIAIVFWENTFFTVPKDALKHHYASHPVYRNLLDNPRQLIYGEKPLTRPGMEEMIQRAKEFDLPPHHHVENYREFKQFFSSARQHGKDIHEIIRHNDDMKRQLKAILQETGKQENDYIYLALKSRYRNIILIFDQNGENTGYLQAPYL